MKRYLIQMLGMALIILGASCESPFETETPIEACQPIAKFEIINDGCVLGCTIDFNNTSESATSFSWDFGDGNSSTEKSPSHVYESAGKFDVVLNCLAVEQPHPTQHLRSQ